MTGATTPSGLLEPLRAWARRERPLGAVALAALVGALAVVAVIAAAMPETAAARWLLAAACAGALGFICARSTTQGVLLTFLWLVALGSTRRLASEILADPARDPFILVGVCSLVILAARALLVGALHRLTPLAWGVLAFTGLAVVQLANPNQPSGLARLAGLLLWLAPITWFWVGRALVGEQLAERLLLLVAGVTTVTACYGIAQTLAGFPPWDQRWIDLRGYSSLYIGPGTFRPFASYASAVEFALSCAVGAVVAAVAVFGPRLVLRADPAGSMTLTRQTRTLARSRTRRTRRVFVVASLMFATTLVGLLVSSIRTSLVLLVVALAVVYVVLHGRRAWRVLLPALLLFTLGIAFVSQVDPNSMADHGVSASLRRIVVFVHDPFANNRASPANTLQLHYENAKHGVDVAFSDPLGRGTGATGLAGEHFGGGTTSTDFDLSDAGIAFGVVGLLLSTGIVVMGIVTAVRVALWQRTFERVALVGVLIVSLGAWFQGAHYAMAPLLWLLLGRADATLARGRSVDESTPAPEATPGLITAPPGPPT